MPRFRPRRSGSSSRSATVPPEDYDRTDKFDHYKQIPSLQHYVLVSHREHAVEVWSRAGDAWSQAIVHEGASASLSAIGASLDVCQLYARASEPV